ncbi:hypothetical protein OIU84_029772 [Salix udensis]|uniref:PIN domain-containing protein n=1 Tax=Salix udensis TaxID=889485 RepID=A0AAD6KAJ6_9ROSI|nr:hypothetical protein OIU84_029772 [Salix udensis]
MHFEDTVSAAQAAAESAKQAIAAAQAAAYLANNGLNQASLVPGLDHKLNTSNINHGLGILSGNSTAPSMPLYSQINSQRMDHYSDGPGGTPYESQNFDRSHYPGNEGTRPIQTDSNHVYRRHSHIETMPKQMDGQNVSRRHNKSKARLTATASTILVLDTNVVLNQIDLLENPAIEDVVLLSVVLQEEMTPEAEIISTKYTKSMFSRATTHTSTS